MFARTTRYSWIVALLVLSLSLVMITGCSEDDEDTPVGPSSNGPALGEPADGADVDLKDLADNNEDLMLTWDEVEGAEGYHIQVASDPLFGAATLIIDAETDTNYYMPQVNKLFVNVEHYWRVAAIMDGMVDDYSSTWSFTPTADALSTDMVLEGEILDDMTIDAGSTVLLRGGVFIGSDNPNGNGDAVTLTVQEGVTFYGESATDGMLVIRRGGAIEAMGTQSQPIVFTSDKPAGQRGRGDWGGVIINGEAVLNTGEAFGEGDTGPYGGSLDTDDSGTLRYVRIEFAGREISPDNELNGLALQGVGSSTTIEYVQVHMNQDDGVEFFGGTARAKYLYVTGCADDQFDWTDGWRGYGQYWVCQQYADDADQGIEADNNGDNNTAEPYSNPTLSNITLVGARNSTEGESDIGMLLREGTKATIVNSLVMYFGEAGVNVDGGTSEDNADAGSLSVMYSAFFDNAAVGADDFDDDFVANETTNFIGANPELNDPYSTSSPNFTPTAGSFVLDTDNAMDPTDLDGWFDDAQYIGAMSDMNWIAGWTTSAAN